MITRRYARDWHGVACTDGHHTWHDKFGFGIAMSGVRRVLHNGRQGMRFLHAHYKDIQRVHQTAVEVLLMRELLWWASVLYR